MKKKYIIPIKIVFSQMICFRQLENVGKYDDDTHDTL